MKAHVMFLASDAMNGREAGSPEYDIAAQYVAAQFYAAGLKPGRGRRHVSAAGAAASAIAPAGEGDFAWTPRGRTAQRLEFGDGLCARAPIRSGPRSSVAAPVVFVGYGVRRAAIRARRLSRASTCAARSSPSSAARPPAFGGEERAHLRLGADQGAAIAAAHGAVGVIQIADPRAEAANARRAATYDGAADDLGGSGRHGQRRRADRRSLGTLSPRARPSCSAAPRRCGRGARRPKPAPRYRSTALAGTLAAATQTGFAKAPSSNVVGHDPRQRSGGRTEVVVLSAHLDHIGVGPERRRATDQQRRAGQCGRHRQPDRGGQALQGERASRPRRSILFLAVTARGEGADRLGLFRRAPDRAARTIVADVNLDMPILTYRVRGHRRVRRGALDARADRAARGGGGRASGCRPIRCRRRASSSARTIIRFVQQGVPSVFLWPGPARAGQGGGRRRSWPSCYHKPSRRSVAADPVGPGRALRRGELPRSRARSPTRDAAAGVEQGRFLRDAL